MEISETNHTRQTPIRDAARLYVGRRFAILFYSLLVTIAVAPGANAMVGDSALTELLLGTNVVLAAVSALAGNTRRVLVVVALGAWAFYLVTSWLERDEFLSVGLGIWTAIALLAAAGSIRYAMRASKVDSEHIYAALSAYLLAGLFFGVFHFLIAQTFPGSFAINVAGASAVLTVEDALYFSFVTLATLGYGDIVPTSQAARGFAIVEAVAGQLYLAVMIARLVSLYVPERREEE